MILVLANKGGVGKSTVAANLAASLAVQGHRTALADADIHGPNAAQFFGQQGEHTRVSERGIHPRRWGGDGQVVAVGDEGAIVAFDGNRWLAHAAPSPLHLHGVWGRRADQVYAVGDFATVVEFDGSRWREIHRLGIDVAAVAVAGFGPHDLFVVGDEGLILRSDGIGFERIDGKTRNALYALWGLDADHVLAVGDFGAILRWNGREWNSFSAGTEAFLYGVCGRALDDVVVVGLSGTTAHFDGRRWSRRVTGTTADLLGVAPLDDTRWIAVGTRGTALVWDGGTWVEEDTGTDAGLRAVWAAPDGTAYAVGDGGTVRRRSP